MSSSGAIMGGISGIESVDIGRKSDADLDGKLKSSPAPGRFEFMMNTLKTDVLIIGAGPTGLSLACQFVRHGVDFLVIEKNESITPYSKAIGVHARTLEIYEQIGMAR